MFTREIIQLKAVHNILSFGFKVLNPVSTIFKSKNLYSQAMKHLKNIACILIFVFASVSIFGQTAEIHMEIQNIEGTGGELVTGIFDNATDFKNKTKPFRASKIEITDSSVSYTYLDIPIGNYAIAVFHDTNGDGKVNTKSMKIPTEGVGVSGKMPKMRAPKFEETAFKLENDTVIIIRMVYPSSK